MSTEYLEFSNTDDFEIRQRQMFSDLGYTPEIQKRTKTYRYADPIKHPKDSRFLMVISDVTSWRGVDPRQENPRDVSLVSEEKTRLKTRDQCITDGYFAEDQPSVDLATSRNVFGSIKEMFGFGA